MTQALLLIGGYLLGACPFGYWLTKLTKGLDVRTIGSGNIGFTNVYRAVGPGIASIVFVLDMAKGVLPALAARLLFPENDLWWLLAGGASVAGHNWSPFLGFKGGRGVCTTCGVLLAVRPPEAAITLALWALLVVTTKYVSLASLVATVTFISLALARGASVPLKVFCAIAGTAIVVRHIPNIKRLLRGEENKIGHAKESPPADGSASSSETEEAAE